MEAGLFFSVNIPTMKSPIPAQATTHTLAETTRDSLSGIFPSALGKRAHVRFWEELKMAVVCLSELGT